MIAVAIGVASGCTSSPSPIPSPDLGGLDPRPHMPPLVDGEVDGCLPLCRSAFVAGVPLESGRYQTQNFFGGYMTASFGDGWTAGEDSTGEFKVFGPDDAEYGSAFALDAFPVKDGQRIRSVPNTAAGMVEWLLANPYLVVSEPRTARIGELPATAVDIRLADGAPMDEADCGAPCVGFIGFEQWTDTNGILGDDIYRFVWSDVSYGGTPHVLSLYVEGRDAAHLETMLGAVQPVVESVTVPARPGGGSS